MDCASNSHKQQELLAEIFSFLKGAKGLCFQEDGSGATRIKQMVDGKSVVILAEDLDDVIKRTDTEGQEFIQVNFRSGRKILLTSALVGFKPLAIRGLDLARLPKVVTTPDILSVFEAIQDSLDAADGTVHELNVLKKVFEAVIRGGEDIGFDLSSEREWLLRLPTSVRRISA